MKKGRFLRLLLKEERDVPVHLWIKLISEEDRRVLKGIQSRYR